MTKTDVVRAVNDATDVAALRKPVLPINHTQLPERSTRIALVRGSFDSG
jgi:hypothetical protein